MNACAYIVGPDDGPGAALADIANGLDFAAVKRFTGVAQAEQQALQTPLCFFLFAAVEDVRKLVPAASAIRSCPTRAVRFSPLIYFSESPSIETIKHCINMGFDDILTMPFTRQRVEERLALQLDRTLVYCETGDYFGPDRRSYIREAAAPSRDRSGPLSYRRIEIMRNLRRGVLVLREDAHAAA